jgi:hypothetical protein
MRVGAECSPVGPTQGPWTTIIKEQNHQDFKKILFANISTK